MSAITYLPESAADLITACTLPLQPEQLTRVTNAARNRFFQQAKQLLALRPAWKSKPIIELVAELTGAAPRTLNSKDENVVTARPKLIARAVDACVEGRIGDYWLIFGADALALLGDGAAPADAIQRAFKALERAAAADVSPGDRIATLEKAMANAFKPE